MLHMIFSRLLNLFRCVALLESIRLAIVNYGEGLEAALLDRECDRVGQRFRALLVVRKKRRGGPRRCALRRRGSKAGGDKSPAKNARFLNYDFIYIAIVI
jgi:hypothetical protein